MSQVRALPGAPVKSKNKQQVKAGQSLTDLFAFLCLCMVLPGRAFLAFFDGRSGGRILSMASVVEARNCGMTWA